MADGELAGQVGVELPVIRVGSNVLRTFGVVDLCVRGSERPRDQSRANGSATVRP